LKRDIQTRDNHPRLLLTQRQGFWIAACVQCGRFLAAARTIEMVYVVERCHSCTAREFPLGSAGELGKDPAA